MRVDEMQSMTSIASNDSDLMSDELFEPSPDMVSDRKMALEKRKYQERIISLCNDKERPLNVAVIGPPGVGKSSLVNTIAASFSDDTWREFAYSGFHGDASQITVFTRSFPKCCHGDDEKFKQVNLPTLIDIAGFTNEERERYVELLRIVFYGRLPEGESLAEADEYYQKFGLEGLRQKYSRNNEKLKVDRVVVVASATEEVPKNLINCVVQAARPSGLSESRKRTIPLFGVMTKQDKIGSDMVTKEIYEEREKQFVNAVGLAGSMHRFLRCRNYCDDVDHGRRTETVIPELDLPALKFMSQLADPVIEVLNKDETYETTGEGEAVAPLHQPDEAEPTIRRRQVSATEADTTQPAPPKRVPSRTPPRQGGNFLQDLNLTSDQMFCGFVVIEAVILGIILQVLLTPPVEMGKLRGVCKYMQSQPGQMNFNMQEFCDSLGSHMGKEATTMLILLAFVGVRVGIKFLFEKLQKLQNQ